MARVEGTPHASRSLRAGRHSGVIWLALEPAHKIAPMAILALRSGAVTRHRGYQPSSAHHTRPDGRTVIVESRQVLIRDADEQPSAILEINRDITARRRMEEAESSAQASTLAQLAFLQQVVDALPNGVYIVHGHDARLVLANQAATSTWGAVWQVEQPMQDFFDQHQIRLTDAQGRSLAPEKWVTMRALREGEPILHFQEVIHRPRGDALPVLVNVAPLKFSYWQRVGMAPSVEDVRAGLPSGMTRDAGQEPLALVIQQDVHVLKEAEYLTVVLSSDGQGTRVAGVSWHAGLFA
jgi:PAS domain-containing protein